MKKAFAAFIVFLALALSACTLNPMSSWPATLSNFGFSEGDFTVISEDDSHGGFHGDGDSLIVLDCSGNSDKAVQIVSDWNALPLSENLQLIMYGGEKDGVNYAYNLAEEAGIPVVTNGCYRFCDRHSQSSNSTDDSELLSRSSFNFSLAIYDADTDTLYYYEFDT